jgi:hypothetical protein
MNTGFRQSDFILDEPRPSASGVEESIPLACARGSPKFRANAFRAIALGPVEQPDGEHGRMWLDNRLFRGLR